MRRLSIFALLCVSAASIASSQQAASSAPSLPADAKQERVKVYAVGHDVTAPELLPLDMAPIVAENCEKIVDGKVVLSVIVDAKGNPRNLMFVSPLGSELDRFALKIAAVDRFKPGTYEGAPVAVAQTLDVDLQSCLVETTDDQGKKAYRLRLISLPDQKLEKLPHPPEEAVLTSDNTFTTLYHAGAGVKYPVLLNHVYPEFSVEAKAAKYRGVCLVALVVDQQGMPQHIRVERPLGMGLDENAIKAVSQYRFKPAMKDGEPVAMVVSVEIKFDIY
jgi:TonB family protein